MENNKEEPMTENKEQVQEEMADANKNKNFSVSINTGTGNKEPFVLYLIALSGYPTCGLGFLAALIFAYIIRNKKDDTHKELCRYYIRTFWIGLGLGTLSIILFIFIIGVPLAIGLSIWFLYRTIKGTYYSYKYQNPFLKGD